MFSFPLTVFDPISQSQIKLLNIHSSRNEREQSFQNTFQLMKLQNIFIRINMVAIFAFLVERQNMSKARCCQSPLSISQTQHSRMIVSKPATYALCTQRKVISLPQTRSGFTSLSVLAENHVFMVCINGSPFVAQNSQIQFCG